MALTAQAPIFDADLQSASAAIGTGAPELDGTATVADGGSITYQWQQSTNGSSWSNISGETGPTYTPPTTAAGTVYYRVIATNTRNYPYGLTPSTTLYPSETLYPIAAGASASAESTSNSAAITVYAAQAPVFNGQLASAAYNQGETVAALDGTATAPHGSVTYQWYQDGTEIPGETGPTYIPSSAAAGVHTYYVVAVNTVGTSSVSAASNTATITIYGAEVPVFQSPLASASYYQGASATALDGTAEVERGTLTYQWYKDGAAIPNATGAIYTPDSSAAGASQYYVIVTNTVGTSTASATSNTATITVYGGEAPVFGADLVSAAYAVGSSAAALDGTASAPHGEISYQWQRSANGTAWTDIPGEIGATYTPPTGTGGTVYYRVVAINTVGTSTASATSNIATITVYTAASPVFSSPLSGAEYNMGDTAAALNGTATASHGSISYQWYRNGAALPGETGATYTPPTNAAGSNSYYVIATNTVGTSAESSTSNTVTITVYGASTPQFNAALVGAEYDAGAAAAALDGTATAARGSLSYQWYSSVDGDVFSPIADGTQALYTPPTGAGGTVYYRVTATNTVGTDSASATSNSAAITVYTATAPVFSGPLTGAEYDIGDAATTLNGTATAPRGSITYQWYCNGAAISGANQATYTPPTGTAGTFQYSVTATNTVGTTTESAESNTVTVTVYAATPPAFAGALADAAYDIGDSADALNGTATAARGTVSYQWYASGDNQDFSPLQGETGPTYTPPTTADGTIYYRVVATNTVGTSAESSTSNSAAITVYAATAPVFTLEPQSATYDIGDSAAALTCAATAPRGTVSYQWARSTDGESYSPIAGETQSSFTPPVDAGGTVYYRCTATNIVGTSSAQSQSDAAAITVRVATAPAFLAALVGATYNAGDSVTALNGTAVTTYGTISYQWYQDGQAIPGANQATYTPDSSAASDHLYYVVATNTVGTSTAQTQSNSVQVVIYGATAPEITLQPAGADYIENDLATALAVAATAPRGSLSYQWEMQTEAGFAAIPGAEESSYTPSTSEPGAQVLRCIVTNTVGTSTASTASQTATVTVTAAQTPVFTNVLLGGTYNYGSLAPELDGTATVTDGGVITYQWERSQDGGRTWAAIQGAEDAAYRPLTVEVGTQLYRVRATNTLHNSQRSALSNTAEVVIVDTRLSKQAQYRLYLASIGRPFIKLCRLRFLQPDGSTAFALDNNPLGSRSGAFIQSGTITCNRQNGQRRTADVTLSNLDGAYDYSINNVWFGQQIALDEGLILPDGSELYFPQGVFYVQDPQETLMPGQIQVVYHLVDKWAYLDGTLFGNLEGTYEVPVGTNIFAAIASLLALDRGNGYPVDSVMPVCTEYYNGKTQALPDGSSALLTDSPYTLRVDSEDGTYADVALGLADMLVAWIGYDPVGALRIDASQEDLLDTDKPILWQFSPEEVEFLGATYTVQNTQVYNDYIVIGEALDGYAQPAGRATNMDAMSDTNIYTSLGRRTKRISAAGYTTQRMCEDLAAWKLKRSSVLQKSVTISCQQMFHIVENNLITIVRTDKPGSPVERHVVTGFSRPLAQTGAMTINAVSVQDFPAATITGWPD